MPGLESITKWYNQSQIEYITPFLKLWLSFEGYLKNTFPNLNIQRDLIDKIKAEHHLYQWFERYIQEQSEQGEIFRKSIERLVQLTRINPLTDNQGRSISFNTLIDQRAKPPIAEIIKLPSINLIRDNREVFKQLIEVIYQVRNALVHGSFLLDNPSHIELVEKAYNCLNIMFGSIM